MTVPLCPPVTICLPSGLNDAEKTSLVCPARVRSFWPVAASQTMAVWSYDAVTMLLPSGLNDADPARVAALMRLAGEGAELLPAGRVPDDGDMVVRGDDSLAVRAEQRRP